MDADPENKGEYRRQIMGKNTGPKCRICRRELTKLYLKGSKCYTDKCALEQRKYPPGKSKGLVKRKQKLFGFNRQLREKQKVKRHYGMREKQFYLFFLRANKMSGVTGDNLIQLLERRLDNVIYKSGLATSRNHARQLIKHGFIRVNDKNVNIPSFIVSKDDTIGYKDNKKEKAEKIVNEGKKTIEASGDKLPTWFDIDYEKFKVKINDYPTTDDINIPVEVNLIVELYSK